MAFLDSSIVGRDEYWTQRAFASKSLGTTMVDLFENEQLRKIKAEIFLKRKGKEAMLPDGPPPVLKCNLNEIK
jgi:hypothetical protein